VSVGSAQEEIRKDAAIHMLSLQGTGIPQLSCAITRPERPCDGGYRPRGPRLHSGHTLALPQLIT
jgi:hypothetical protein